ncbi:Thioredoxin-like protein 4A, partial [Lamprotornis superbus]
GTADPRGTAPHPTCERGRSCPWRCLLPSGIAAVPPRPAPEARPSPCPPFRFPPVPRCRRSARQPAARMSYMLPHLHNGWQVDQAILSEEDRVVVIRFGHDWDPTCMKMDEVLYSIAEKVKNFAVIYLVDITEVPDFNKMYELYDPCTVMFFFRNKHIMIDLGTGNNNKINWAMEDKQEMIDIIETVYRGARKGRASVMRSATRFSRKMDI